MRFHKAIGFPANVKIPTNFFNLVATRHAQLSALDDKYGSFRIPVSIRNADVFELITDGDKVLQYGVRAKWNENLDIVLIVLKPNTVKTAWLTERNDNHRTLDLSKYDALS